MRDPDPHSMVMRSPSTAASLTTSTVSPVTMDSPGLQPPQGDAASSAARRLLDAAAYRKPCPPVRDLLGETDIGLAYATQALVVDDRIKRGGVVTGQKIGLTAPAVQQQLGVDQPDFGMLFADMDVSRLDRVPYDVLLQPKIEAEIAFGLSANLDSPNIDMNMVRESVGWAAAALEIVDSRVADWDIRITDTIADNASSGLYVVSQHRLPLSRIDPSGVQMRMWIDGTLTSEGNCAACLGDPLRALLWLARTAQRFGRPLRAGQVVLSGALGPMAAVDPGVDVTAEITTLGEVSACFGDRPPR